MKTTDMKLGRRLRAVWIDLRDGRIDTDEARDRIRPIREAAGSRYAFVQMWAHKSNPGG
jgi:hypothetical protein